MKSRKLSALFVFLASCTFAQEPIRYTLRFPAPHTHYLEATASIPAGTPSVELYMAVWTPGSYLVREYAGHMEDFAAKASNGRALTWQKTRKNRWLVNAQNAGRIEVTYRVYAHEISVQGNWVDAGFAMLNGAPNFLSIVGDTTRPYEIKLELPAAWKKSISGMKRKPGESHTYLASDFDQLIDSPIYAGNAPIHEFDVAGKKHYLVNEGEGPMWDGPASARDVQKIVEEYARMWNGLPYDHYVFFNMIVEAGGGLEHRNSTWMNASRWAYGNDAEPPAPGSTTTTTRTPTRTGWLSLVSHEYFHTWNVKRLRPEALGPFDYENENYTHSLWISEGLTSYYAPVANARAGVISRARLLTAMSAAINSLQTAPGRLAQPVETSSYDTWIKFYRPNENSINTGISYYTKGQVLGFVLDAKVRKATNGKKSLDDVMRRAYELYSGPKGFTPAQFRKVASDVAGIDLSEWFKTNLETTAELTYTEALDWYGLRFRAPASRTRPAINSGITARAVDGRIIVQTVKRDTPGYASGVNVGDELIAINGVRLGATDWPSRLERYKPGDKLHVLVARRGQLTVLELPVVEEAPQSWVLEVKPDATEQQKANLAAWIAVSR